MDTAFIEKSRPLKGLIQIEKYSFGAIGSKTKINTKIGKCFSAEHDP
jgi:hypothetical protein